MTERKESKPKQLTIRCTQAEYDLIKKAVEIDRRGLGVWMIDACLVYADIQKQERKQLRKETKIKTRRVNDV